MATENELTRAKWNQAAREAYHKEHPENFAGPDMSYPVRDGSDVADAWNLAGHAADPEAVRSKIKAIAKRLGLESSLPDTAKEDAAKERMMNASPEDTTTQLDEQTAEQQTEERSQESTIQSSDRYLMNLPLVRIDANKREVWGQATAEVPDSYGTIFGFYPDAWTKWRGNIREQHDPKKAVGTAIDIKPLPEERAIYVGSRVSRGAQDTWLKVEDNVLTGYSASIIPDPEFGHDISKWPKKTYNGKEYPYLPRYTVAELSLVDNPACPGCNIAIVRADGFATEVLDLTEEETPPPSEPSSQEETLERAGARMSNNSRAVLHDMRDKAMSLCGCDECSGMMERSAPEGVLEREVAGIIERILEKQLSAVYLRLQGIAGTLARSNANTPTDAGVLERAVATTIASSFAEVRASQGAVEEQVEKIAKQVEAIANTPVPGAPINTGALPKPAMQRTLATEPPAEAPTGAVYTAMREQFARNSEAGLYSNLDQQLADAARVLAAQPRSVSRR